jgi:hypothetical protein
MTKHLNEPIDAACPITRPGGTAAQIGGSVGGIAGAAIASGGSKPRDSDVPIGQFAWLGLGADHFTLTKANFMGKPSDSLARVAYADVAAASMTDGKLTVRVDLDLKDGRHIAFESKRHGQNKANADVIDELRTRCPTG